MGAIWDSSCPAESRGERKKFGEMGTGATRPGRDGDGWSGLAVARRGGVVSGWLRVHELCGAGASQPQQANNDEQRASNNEAFVPTTLMSHNSGEGAGCIWSERNGAKCCHKRQI